MFGPWKFNSKEKSNVKYSFLFMSVEINLHKIS